MPLALLKNVDIDIAKSMTITTGTVVKTYQDFKAQLTTGVPLTNGDIISFQHAANAIEATFEFWVRVAGVWTYDSTVFVPYHSSVKYTVKFSLATNGDDTNSSVEILGLTVPTPYRYYRARSMSKITAWNRVNNVPSSGAPYAVIKNITLSATVSITVNDAAINPITRFQYAKNAFASGIIVYDNDDIRFNMETPVTVRTKFAEMWHFVNGVLVYKHPLYFSANSYGCWFAVSVRGCMTTASATPYYLPPNPAIEPMEILTTENGLPLLVASGGRALTVTPKPVYPIEVGPSISFVGPSPGDPFKLPAPKFFPSPHVPLFPEKPPIELPKESPFPISIRIGFWWFAIPAIIFDIMLEYNTKTMTPRKGSRIKVAEDVDASGFYITLLSAQRSTSPKTKNKYYNSGYGEPVSFPDGNGGYTPNPLFEPSDQYMPIEPGSSDVISLSLAHPSVMYTLWANNGQYYWNPDYASQMPSPVIFRGGVGYSTSTNGYLAIPYLGDPSPNGVNFEGIAPNVPGQPIAVDDARTQALRAKGVYNVTLYKILSGSRFIGTPGSLFFIGYPEHEYAYQTPTQGPDPLQSPWGDSVENWYADNQPSKTYPDGTKAHVAYLRQNWQVTKTSYVIVPVNSPPKEDVSLVIQASYYQWEMNIGMPPTTPGQEDQPTADQSCFFSNVVPNGPLIGLFKAVYPAGAPFHVYKFDIETNYGFVGNMLVSLPLPIPGNIP